MLTILLVIAFIALFLWLVGGFTHTYSYGSPIGYGPLLAVLLILFLIWLFFGGVL